MQKKTIFSGMQATGNLHIGNWLGAARNWAKLSADYNCLYCVVDLHALTVRQDPAQLRNNARSVLAWYIALGINPDENILYFQSHVAEHAELAWILNCYTYMGELNRMTQFKDKSAKNEENINAGLFTYPVLMAADILLFQTHLVPVGDDQRQHVELARDVAQRFNHVYGDIFVIPEGYIPPVGARIMALQDPTRKMSKSDENISNSIFLSDTSDAIIKKFKRAVTDSDGQVRYAPEEKAGVSNLLSIYSCVTGRTPQDCEKDFAGQGYGALKTTVGEALVEAITPYRNEHARLMADTAYLDGIIASGAAQAKVLATSTMARVKKAVGLPK
ncbi:MAG: tryptophan--tRNA ligase [Defluviitaleaceae bacterium]|nr:tryptophan--tRNA ligase [Defluviitaleaceae bacterium]MCL2273788.1 tryptophan--tRNA ligase [Defluviitaleaceae bacterium]